MSSKVTTTLEPVPRVYGGCISCPLSFLSPLSKKKMVSPDAWIGGILPVVNSACPSVRSAPPWNGTHGTRAVPRTPHHLRFAALLRFVVSLLFCFCATGWQRFLAYVPPQQSTLIACSFQPRNNLLGRLLLSKQQARRPGSVSSLQLRPVDYRPMK